jgi:hypothetical protein
MSDQSDRDILLALAERVNDVREDVGDIKVTMALNTASLVEHMRRTEALEKQLEPVKAHVTMVNNILKLIGFIALLAGIAEKLYTWVK